MPVRSCHYSLFTFHYSTRELIMIEELRQKYEDLAARAVELRRFL
jgi:hypothetical protein